VAGPEDQFCGECGAFIYGLLRGWTTPDMLEFAAAAAAVSCTRLGALDGVPQLEDVERLLESAGSAHRVRDSSGDRLQTAAGQTD
jgi:hypothetical protein